jgi:hypothetical protein
VANITEATMVDNDLTFDSNGQVKTETGQDAIWCGCGRVWTAAREAHCAGCHLHFSSDSAFDAHRNPAPRLGPYDEAVLCKSETELRESGRLVEKASRFGRLWARPGSWGGPELRP